MSAVFKKLNLKDQAEVVVLGAPASFEPEIAALRDVTVRRSLGGVRAVTFALAFVMRQPEVDELAGSLTSRAVGDAVVWFAYPKQSSKNYRSEIDRDHRWAVLGRAGFEPVRMVAIDADWSAVRFRRVENIKTMMRPASYALSAGGKAKSAASAGAKPRGRQAAARKQRPVVKRPRASRS